MKVVLQALGGAPGAATFALMAAGVMALPLKFPFYENSLLLVFSAFTYLIAANSSAFAFGREETAAELLSGHGAADRAAVFMRAQTPLIAAIVGWAVLLGLALISLRSVRPAAPLPGWLALAGLLALNSGVAAAVTMLGALVGLSVQKVKATRDLLRMGFTFLLVLLVLGFFFLPDPARARFWRVAQDDIAFCTAAAIAGGVLTFAAQMILRRVVGLLAEKRQGLSILG